MHIALQPSTTINQTILERGRNVGIPLFFCYRWVRFLRTVTPSVKTTTLLSTGPLSDLRYRQVRLDLGFIVRMRDRQAPLPPITADCHRLLPAIIVAWEISRGYTRRQRYQIMVVQTLTEQIPEPIVFWFVIFGFVRKCVIHCMFDGMQDSSISTKTWSCKID